MNRPNFTDKKYQYSKNKTIREDWIEYNKDLEKYCDKLEIALEKACETIATIEPIFQNCTYINPNPKTKKQVEMCKDKNGNVNYIFD